MPADSTNVRPVDESVWATDAATATVWGGIRTLQFVSSPGVMLPSSMAHPRLTNVVATSSVAVFPDVAGSHQRLVAAESGATVRVAV